MNDDTDQRRARREGCPSELALERWRTGEPASEVGRHVEGCALCQASIAALAAARAPALDVDALWVEAVRARSPWARARRWWDRSRWLGLSLAMAGAAWAVAPGIGATTREATKGPGWTLGVIMRQHDDQQRAVEPGDALRPGDQLRFQVFAPTGSAHVALFSVDSAGVVSRLAPAGETTAFVQGGQRHLLEEAVELDDVLGPERLILLACPTPRAVADLAEVVTRALQLAGGDPRAMRDVGAGCDETTLLVEKVAR